MAQRWLEGAFYAGAGYLAGIGMYAFMRTVINLTIESILDAKCGKTIHGRVCDSYPGSDSKSSTSWSERWSYNVFRAFDLQEFSLVFVIGGFLNVANELLMVSIPTVKAEFKKLKRFSQDYRSIPGITGSMSNWLSLNGAVASLVQSLGLAAWTGAGISSVPTVIGVFFGALTNTMYIDTIGDRLSNKLKFSWNIAAWAMATSITRFGSPTDDIRQIEELIGSP